MKRLRGWGGCNDDFEGKRLPHKRYPCAKILREKRRKIHCQALFDVAPFRWPLLLPTELSLSSSARSSGTAAAESAVASLETFWKSWICHSVCSGGRYLFVCAHSLPTGRRQRNAMEDQRSRERMLTDLRPLGSVEDIQVRGKTGSICRFAFSPCFAVFRDSQDTQMLGNTARQMSLLRPFLCALNASKN